MQAKGGWGYFFKPGRVDVEGQPGLSSLINRLNIGFVWAFFVSIMGFLLGAISIAVLSYKLTLVAKKDPVSGVEPMLKSIAGLLASLFTFNMIMWSFTIVLFILVFCGLFALSFQSRGQAEALKLTQEK